MRERLLLRPALSHCTSVAFDYIIPLVVPLGAPADGPRSDGTTALRKTVGGRSGPSGLLLSPGFYQGKNP